MKKTFILTALGVILTIPTFAAVQRCVALNNSTTCAFITPEDHASIWESSCTTNGKHVPITGVFTCGIRTDDIGKTSDTIEATSAGHCWCKAISPAISKWVAVGDGYGSGNESESYTCEIKCAYDCAKFMSDNATFRNAIISTMGQN